MTKSKLCPTILKTFSIFVAAFFILGFNSATCISDGNSFAVQSKADTLNSDAATKEIVIVPNKGEILYFNTKLRETDRAYLNALVRYLKENPKLKVRIVGHSDNSGTTEDNLQSSRDRASVVFRFLVDKGIERGRLYLRGVGTLYPIETNATEQGRRKNRRVEIITGAK